MSEVRKINAQKIIDEVKIPIPEAKLEGTNLINLDLLTSSKIIEKNKSINTVSVDINDGDVELLNFFKGKKIYIEVFIENICGNAAFFEKLSKYSIIPCKKLNKNIDYIVFKDGHLKTRRYAIENGIKLVNPLWIDDKLNKKIFKDDKEYEIKTNFGEIVLMEKYNKILKEEKSNSNKNNILDKVFDIDIEDEFDYEFSNRISKSQSKKDFGKGVGSNIKIKKSQISLDKIKKNKNVNYTNKNKKESKRTKRRSYFNTNYNTIKSKNSKLNKDLQNNFRINVINNELGLTKPVNNIFHHKKIELISYKLGLKDVEYLKSLTAFNYIKNIDNYNKDNKVNSGYPKIIIVDKEKTKYDWEFYKYIFDGEVLIDSAVFFLEFFEDDNIANFSNEELTNKIKNISINNELNFKMKKNFIANEKEKFTFIIDEDFIEDEKKILKKLINFFGGNINKSIEKSKKNSSIEPKYVIRKYKSKILPFIKKDKKDNIEICHKYVYDSALKGYLLDLNNSEIFNKYKI